MKIKIAWIGKTKEPAIQSLTDEYLKRINRYAEAEHLVLKDEDSLAAYVNRANNQPRHYFIVLDSRGKQLSSSELAEFLRKKAESSSQPLLFAIGPADGFRDDTRQTASLLLSLSKMTLPHELARVVLLEQLYRALTILAGHPYHSGH